MDYNHLRDSVRSIKMPDDMKNRIMRNATLRSSKANNNPAGVWKKPIAAILVVLLLLTASIPVLAATVESIYELMYLVSPAIAQYFQPIQKADEVNGIRMEVVSAYIHENTAEVYITMQDLTNDRIDETTDLYDSYFIHSPFDSSAHCERIGFDTETKTATFLITIDQAGSQDIEGDKITFSVKQFLSHKSKYEGIEIPFDLMTVSEAVQTQQVESSSGGGLSYESGKFNALVPSEPYAAFPVNGINFTGIALVDSKLHIQVAIEDRLRNDNHGYFYLMDAAGNKIEDDASYYFIDDSTDTRVDYIEYVFSITPDILAECDLYGDFWVSGLLTEGNWKITFPLELDHLD